MNTIRFTPNINRSLNSDEVHKLHSLIPYCGEDVLGWTIHHENPVTIVCELAENAKKAEVMALLEVAVKHALNTRILDEKVVFDQWQQLPSKTGEYPSSLEQEYHKMSDGLWVFGPVFTKIVKALDEFIVNIAAQHGGEELLVPSMIPRQHLNQTAYTRNFPHHIASIHTLPHDLNILREFTASGSSDTESFKFTGNYLLPAACLNCYPYIAEKKKADSHTFTVLAQCSRYEAKRMENPTRLWNFRMREIVHLGSEQDAQAFRKKMLDILIPFLRIINLPVRIAASNDPFFIDHGYAVANYQKVLELKYEILARLPDKSSPLAIGSLNLHHDYFGKHFNIQDQKGRPLSSTCTAFGLERWAFWLMSWLGNRLDTWPAEIRETLKL